jgi:hypothetical protein
MAAQDNVLFCRQPVDTDVVGPSWEHFVFVEKILIQKLMWTPRQMHSRHARAVQAMWSRVPPAVEDRRPRNALCG